MKRQNDFLVGLVVILAAAGVTGMALWLSRAHFGPRREAIFARVREVGGSKVGTPVVIRGVEAGRITAIILDEKDGFVAVRITLDAGMSLPPHPVLLLSEASMFGQWEATLAPRESAPPNSDVLAQLDDPLARKGGAIPGAVLPGIGQLSVVAGRIASDVEAVAHRFGTAFSDSAARELRETIKTLNNLSTTLNRTVGKQSTNLDEVAKELLSALGSVNSAAGAIDRTAVRIDSSTGNGQLKEMVTNLRAASVDLKDMAAQLKASATSVNRSAEGFETMLLHTDSVMVKINRGQGTLGLMVNDPTLYRNADSLFSTLRQLAADIKAHPNRYVNVKIF